MPELPEVETIRADLESRLTRRTLTGGQFFWDRTAGRPAADPAGVIQGVTGRTVEAAERRGKFLVLRLSGGAALVVHLRMTGRLTLQPSGAARSGSLRALFSLDYGSELHFEDQRKFGRIYFAEDDTALAEVLSKLGPEPLEEHFSLESFRELVRGRRAQLKPLLLDQRFVAGLGNIYVDEALFRAQLHPLRRSDTLSKEDVTRLHAAIGEALRQGIANRGTTLSDYRDSWGTAGLNREQLLVFRRDGKPCPRCGTPIEKIRVGQRGTHLCPSCQPAP
ncbi:MAG: Formamidopyrimidine-DNA glycosylase [uncultured Chloroflexi bacterium]|uniref:Formamidopyrimidine-DNA glycosylase n=1 Tax=uncultured Chloroflexota bacterium TaxID=166587 RepID=A0A6J4I1E0_9CHLR|nr:MAG: Formamidopyrimidine-DNA glycosylase [uncultured Chloroflexota bacterium]